MPLHKPPTRRVLCTNRQPNRPPPQPHQPPRSRTPPPHPPGHQNPKPTTLPLQPHRPKVQRLMMHTAKRQAIRHHISAIVGVPPNVRGLQSEQAVAEPNVVLADRTSLVVRLKHTLPEPGIPRRVLPDLPPPSWHGIFKSGGAWPRRKLHGVQDILMDRSRKMLGQDLPSRAGHEFRVAA